MEANEIKTDSKNELGKAYLNKEVLPDGVHLMKPEIIEKEKELNMLEAEEEAVVDGTGNLSDELEEEDEEENNIYEKDLILPRYKPGISIYIHFKDLNIPYLIDFYAECLEKYKTENNFLNYQNYNNAKKVFVDEVNSQQEELALEDENTENLNIEESVIAKPNEMLEMPSGTVDVVTGEDKMGSLDMMNLGYPLEAMKRLNLEKKKQGTLDPLLKCINSLSDRINLQHLIGDPTSYFKIGGGDMYYDINDPFLDDEDMYKELRKTKNEIILMKQIEDEYSMWSEEFSEEFVDIDPSYFFSFYNSKCCYDSSSEEKQNESKEMNEKKDHHSESEDSTCNVPTMDVRMLCTIEDSLVYYSSGSEMGSSNGEDNAVHTSNDSDDSDEDIIFNPFAWKKFQKHIPLEFFCVFEKLEKLLDELPLEAQISDIKEIMKMGIFQIFTKISEKSKNMLHVFNRILDDFVEIDVKLLRWLTTTMGKMTNVLTDTDIYRIWFELLHVYNYKTFLKFQQTFDQKIKHSKVFEKNNKTPLNNIVKGITRWRIYVEKERKLTEENVTKGNTTTCMSEHKNNSNNNIEDLMEDMKNQKNESDQSNNGTREMKNPMEVKRESFTDESQNKNEYMENESIQRENGRNHNSIHANDFQDSISEIPNELHEMNNHQFETADASEDILGSTSKEEIQRKNNSYMYDQMNVGTVEEGENQVEEKHSFFSKKRETNEDPMMLMMMVGNNECNNNNLEHINMKVLSEYCEFVKREEQNSSIQNKEECKNELTGKEEVSTSPTIKKKKSSRIMDKNHVLNKYFRFFVDISRDLLDYVRIFLKQKSLMKDMCSAGFEALIEGQNRVFVKTPYMVLSEIISNLFNFRYKTEVCISADYIEGLVNYYQKKYNMEVTNEKGRTRKVFLFDTQEMHKANLIYYKDKKLKVFRDIRAISSGSVSPVDRVDRDSKSENERSKSGKEKRGSIEKKKEVNTKTKAKEENTNDGNIKMNGIVEKKKPQKKNKTSIKETTNLINDSTVENSKQREEKVETSKKTIKRITPIKIERGVDNMNKNEQEIPKVIQKEYFPCLQGSIECKQMDDEKNSKKRKSVDNSISNNSKNNYNNQFNINNTESCNSVINSNSSQRWESEHSDSRLYSESDRKKKKTKKKKNTEEKRESK